jgi:hypothetical protein
MDLSTMQPTEKVTFFGMTSATSGFLMQHQIAYVSKGNSLDVAVEVRPDGAPLLYLLDGLHQQLRAVTMADLHQRYPHLPGKPALVRAKSLATLVSENVPADLGQQLYLAHYEDSGNRAGLLHAAYDAAQAAGVTPATARWYSQDFVQAAFFGYGLDQEFTNRGLFRGPAAFPTTGHKTVKRQLGQLQLAGVLRYEALPKEGGFYLHFNRQFLPGLAQQLPAFFATFLV